VTSIVGSTSIIVVHPSVPVKTLELIAFARAAGPAELHLPGHRHLTHMTMELFPFGRRKMTHVPYGAPRDDRHGCRPHHGHGGVI
jgi:hypothetical protein